MINTSEAIQKGFNGFEWCGELYHINFSMKGLVFAEGDPDRSKKKVVPEAALNEEDLRVINLTSKEKSELRHIHRELGLA